MAVFRPSCVVNFAITFDESLLPNPNLPTPLSVDDTAVTPSTPVGLTPQPPQFLSTGSNVSFVMARVPKSLTLELPGYRQAGTFAFTIDWRDLPIDPRAVRACSIEVHTGAISDANFAAGIRQVPSVGNPRKSILQTAKFGAAQNAQTLRLVGTVDEWDVLHDKNGSEVSIRGRDMRALLLDTPIGTDPVRANKFLTTIDLSQTIDVVVRQILALNPLFGQFNVQVNSAEWPNSQLPSPGDTKIIPRSRQGAKPSAKKPARPTLPSGLDKINFWDLVVKFCYLCGAIPYFQGTTLIIRPSRSIYDQQRAVFNPLIPTPFANAEPRWTDAQTGKPLDQPIAVRKLLYGRDVESMGFNRKLAGYQRPKVVRAVGINSDNDGKALEANFISGTWPSSGPTAKLTTKMSPSATQAEEEILNIPVHGITDVARLQEIARAVYEEIGRGEMGGTAESPNLASFGGDNSDPDLLRLGPGDGIFLDVNIAAQKGSNPLIATLIDTQRTPYAMQVQTVAAMLGGDTNLANAIVATSRGQVGQLQRFFRVSTVHYAWSTGHMKVSFDFQNYVVARNQVATVSSTPGTVATAPSAKKQPANIVKQPPPPKPTDADTHSSEYAQLIKQGYTPDFLARQGIK